MERSCNKSMPSIGQNWGSYAHHSLPIMFLGPECDKWSPNLIVTYHFHPFSLLFDRENMGISWLSHFQTHLSDPPCVTVWVLLRGTVKQARPCAAGRLDQRSDRPNGGKCWKWNSTWETNVWIKFEYVAMDQYLYIRTIFRGMNIHLPAILMFTRGTWFWHTAMFEYVWICLNAVMHLHFK